VTPEHPTQEQSAPSNKQCAEPWAAKFLKWLGHNRRVIGAFVGLALLTGGIEWGMGRSLLGPDKRFGLWEGSIWSSECSQRLIDPYSLSHIAHGIVFYAALWIFARKLPISARFLIAAAFEAGWEIFENSPLIIQRYREVTMALGYEGDSVLNSVSDLLMMSLGFLLAFAVRPRITVITLVAMELGCALWVRDNLTLNVIMLVRPVAAIKAWQMDGRPPP
jgi:hypothetical protein